jgi:hypothetical protein
MQFVIPGLQFVISGMQFVIPGLTRDPCFSMLLERTEDGCRIKSGMTVLVCHPGQPTCSTWIKGSPRLKRPMFSAKVS